MQDYKIYKSQFIIDNQQALIEGIHRAHFLFKREFGQFDSTWGYAFYNIFAITSPDPLFYQLHAELRSIIRDYVKHDKPLWFQSWANYHMPDQVLNWHNHNWPCHGYISLDPKKTKTVFEGYEIVNELGNIYIGPGHRMHKVEVIESFNTPRITLGFDIEDRPGPSHDQFSLMPL